MEEQVYGRSLPRTRDANGKHIPRSEPRTDPQMVSSMRITDGKFSEDACCRKDRKLERKGRGYECFCFTLSVPLKTCKDVCLPRDFPYRAIHVEDVYIKSNHFVFRDDTCCEERCTEKPFLNEIWFSEGVILEDDDTKLCFGPTIATVKTW